MAFQRRDATDDEIRSLRHIPDKIPIQVWMVLSIAAAERFTFYAITAPWQNFMQNPVSDAHLPGALGLGQSTATSIYNGFFIFSSLAPVPFAFLSDSFLGRHRTFLISLCIYVVACLIMFITSLPGQFSESKGLGGLAASMFLVGLGVGGVKATQPPFLGDQYTYQRPQLDRISDSEVVVISRELTLQYIYNLFHLFANAASISSLVSAVLEREYGFWAAFLLALSSACLAAILMIVFTRTLVRLPAEKQAVSRTWSELIQWGKENFSLGRGHRTLPQSMTAVMASDLKRALQTSRVIFSFTIFYLCYNQISNNLVSQAGQMQSYGFPNDGLQALNGAASVMIWPLTQKGLYPFLQKRRIPFPAIWRAGVAFTIMGLAMAYAAGVQELIYTSGPCFDEPGDCASGRGLPNEVSVWIQAPTYFLIAFSALFGFVALSEIAYSDAPSSMKAVIQSLTQVTQAIGAALGLAISPVAVNPHLVVMYSSLAGVSVLSAVIFVVVFRNYKGMSHG